jgi:predicted glutamine amidotransferase
VARPRAIRILEIVVSHLVAYVGNEPDNMACALFSARGALASRSDKPEGWGLGFVQGGDVLLQKRPRVESKEVDLYGLIKDLRADAVVGRVGFLSDGSTPAEDADPFRFRSWLFGSVGNIGQIGASRESEDAAFESVRERLLESVPDFLRRNIRGKSPSEHIFHLFLSFLHDAASLDAPSPSAGVVHAALRNSMTFLDRMLAGTGGSAVRLALVATNGRCLVAANASYPLRYLHVEGISDCPVCSGRVDRDRDGRRIQHEALRAVVLEANRDVPSRGGWREIPDRSVLVVGADRVPVVSPL